MNKENVARWVDELEFGDHKQAFYSMHKFQDNVSTSCALGVADHLITSQELSRFRYPFFDVPEVAGGYERLPVVQWLGLTDAETRVIINMNDEERYTLPQIGAWVRDNWLKEES